MINIYSIVINRQFKCLGSTRTTPYTFLNIFKYLHYTSPKRFVMFVMVFTRGENMFTHFENRIKRGNFVVLTIATPMSWNSLGKVHMQNKPRL